MEDSPAKTCPTPAREPVWLGNVPAFGGSTSEPFAEFDPDSLSWRTFQLSLLEDWTLFSETWPRAGMTRSGTAYRRQPSAPLTVVTGSSSWPTPTCQDASNDGGPSQFERNSLPLNAAVSSHPTLLLVDDNEDLLALFRRYLAGHKINICSTHSSSDALELAIKTQPNLMVLDVMMPKTDGWELLQSLRSHPQTSTIPLMMCSVLREQPLALSLGATDYLIKPVSQPQLLEVLQRWLGKLHPNE